MKYSCILIVRSLPSQGRQSVEERSSLEERILKLQPLFDEVVVVGHNVASLYFVKQPVVAPHFDLKDFLNYIHAGLSFASNEWSFVCTDQCELNTEKIKHMKGFLSKSQVVLWDENPEVGFYRRHSLMKMEKILRDKLGIDEFLKVVRVRKLMCEV